MRCARRDLAYFAALRSSNGGGCVGGDFEIPAKQWQAPRFAILLITAISDATKPNLDLLIESLSVEAYKSQVLSSVARQNASRFTEVLAGWRPAS